MSNKVARIEDSRKTKEFLNGLHPNYTVQPDDKALYDAGMPGDSLAQQKRVRQSLQLPTWVLYALDGVIESKMTQFNRRSDLMELFIIEGLELMLEKFHDASFAPTLRRARRLREDFAEIKQLREYPEMARQARALIYQQLQLGQTEAAKKTAHRALRLLHEVPEHFRDLVLDGLLRWDRYHDQDAEGVDVEQREPDMDDPVTALLVEEASADPGEDVDLEAGRRIVLKSSGGGAA